jgi:phosphate acetyltransferase
MTRNLLLVPTGHGVGLTATSLGLLRAFDRVGIRAAYSKPLAQPESSGRHDRSTALVRLVTQLEPPNPLPADVVEQRLGSGQVDLLMEDVIAARQGDDTSNDTDVLIVEGLVPSPGMLYSSRIDVALARTLDADVILVGTARSGDHEFSPERIAEDMAIAAAAYDSTDNARVIGAIVNRLTDNEPERVANIDRALGERGIRMIGTSVYRPELSRVRMRDIANGLPASTVLHEGDIDRRVASVIIAAQAVPAVLSSLTEGQLVIVPPDRHDVIMATCLETLNGVTLAGLVLTTGAAPDSDVWELTSAARAAGLTILSVPDLTYHVATTVFNLDPSIPVDDHERANGVADAVADGIDTKWLGSLTAEIPHTPRLSPAAFRHRLVTMSREADKRIVLPEGAEPRTVAAAIASHERGLARCVLLAPPDEVAASARQSGLSLPSDLEIVDPATIAERYVERLCVLRRHKGMTPEIAHNQLSDPVMVGTMMLECGEVDGLVSGAVNTTANTIRPALQVIGTEPDALLVSSLFFMLLPDDVVIYADCAVNPDPDAEQLADIAIQTATTAAQFGIDPRVALISFSTGDSAAGAEIEKVSNATRRVRERRPDLVVDGPLQYDAASTQSVGRVKRPASAVAGHANVYIFPDLNTGNTTYKAVQRSAEVVSIGPVLQGLRKPVNDLSRGSTLDDIIYTIALTAIQATESSSSEVSPP